jgi:hypothetical protein
MTYNIKGGLRSPELLLLRQAVAAYVQQYNAVKAGRPDAEGKAQAQERIDAANAVADRLRLETVPHPLPAVEALREIATTANHRMSTIAAIIRVAEEGLRSSGEAL